MAIRKLTIAEFNKLAETFPVVDVRSPEEFKHAHYPCAYNIPLFTDEERKEVGITYKQKGKQKAIKIGLDYFGPRMKQHIEEAELILKQHRSQSKTLLVHCWRGGMRSAGMAWLFDLYGFEVYTLAGGYKAFRKWALEQFNAEYKMKILGGYTGSSKTELLHEIRTRGESVIDLEGLAHHKGSAFGGIGQMPQPSQEMFENLLALALFKTNEKSHSNYFWLEDESQRIGNMIIPHALWKTIRNAPLYFMDVPFEKRLDFILQHYGNLDKNALINAVLRIQKRLGPNETKITVNFLLENKVREAFIILLEYYDKTYKKSMNNRDNIKDLLHLIPLSGTETAENGDTLLQFVNKQ